VSNELESEEFLQKIGHLRELQQRKMSVEDMGLELIERMLRETKYSGPAVRDIIGQLADGETDAVLKRIMDDFKPDGKRGEGKEEKADVTLTSHPEQKKATEAIKPGRKTGGLADWA
jgi:hypothetical protein